MSIRTHYIIIGNDRHGYTLETARTRTTLVCRSAEIDARYPNEEIPRILAALPQMIEDRYDMLAEALQTEVLRFRATTEEKNSIVRNAQEAGYTSVSSYLRDRALYTNQDN